MDVDSDKGHALNALLTSKHVKWLKPLMFANNSCTQNTHHKHNNKARTISKGNKVRDAYHHHKLLPNPIYFINAQGE